MKAGGSAAVLLPRQQSDGSVLCYMGHIKALILGQTPESLNSAGTQADSAPLWPSVGEVRRSLTGRAAPGDLCAVLGPAVQGDLGMLERTLQSHRDADSAASPERKRRDHVALGDQMGRKKEMGQNIENRLREQQGLLEEGVGAIPSPGKGWETLIQRQLVIFTLLGKNSDTCAV